MLIGLLSDTHIRLSGYPNNLGKLCTDALPAQVKDVFQGVDLILHAGDIYALPILDELECIAPVLASEGDDDPFEVMNDRRVKWRQVINLEGVTIWLAHEHEIWSWDAQESSPDVIIFGHTHQSALKKEDDILWVNPGSTTFPGYRSEPGTVGLLRISSGRAEAEIIQLG